MVNKSLFSSKSDEWETPQDFFNMLNSKYCFDLDPCATSNNKKCLSFYTKEQDGLKQKWSGRVFVNPPYSQIKLWTKKAFEEKDNCEVIVMLIPARTDTKYFHEYIYHKAEIQFIKGRLKFGSSKNSAPIWVERERLRFFFTEKAAQEYCKQERLDFNTSIYVASAHDNSQILTLMGICLHEAGLTDHPQASNAYFSAVNKIQGE